MTADDVASLESPEPEDPENVGRLQNCSPGTADCDRNPANDCEAVLADDPRNCGVCGVQCETPYADSGCMGGTCRVISCHPGYLDSDKDSDNGCETEAPPSKSSKSSKPSGSLIHTTLFR